LRIPPSDRGRVLQCPSCRFFYIAPGRKHPEENSGLPVFVNVSAIILQWPACCACCLDLHDTQATTSHTNVDWANAVMAAGAYGIGYGLLRLAGSTEQKGWEIPYCWECLEHVEGRSERPKRSCCGLDPAVEYCGWYGTVHRFSFYNWKYANRFMLLNRDKCLG
jgi:hypothetical protein